MAQQHVKFISTESHQLSGILDTPPEQPRAYALFAHCFTCSKNLKAVSNISKALNHAGIAVLRFDFTGLGESEGDFADTNFSSNVSDLLSAANYLKEQHQAPSILIGHSLGGAAVLQAAAAIPSAVAVATIGAPSQPDHVTAMLENNRSEIETTGQATVKLGGRPFVIKKQFLEDIEQQNLPASINTLRKALLIMHAPLDNVVAIDNASELFLHAKHPKSFISLDKADHLLSREEDSRYAGHVLAAWASRYLASSQPITNELTSDNAETIARTGPKGFKTDIVSAGHKLTADEPANLGGTNAGPTPYGLLSAALASCTTMTLQMYAKRKNLSLTATVQVNHAKVHATDCEDCTTKTGKIDEFQRRLTLEGELTDEQRRRLVEIADLCPVHRTLHNEVTIRTILEE